MSAIKGSLVPQARNIAGITFEESRRRGVDKGVL